MKMKPIIVILLVTTATCCALGQTNAAPTLGADPNRLELILAPYPWGEYSSSNFVVCSWIRNVSRGTLKSDDLWPVLLSYDLTWETPTGAKRTAHFGGWRGPKPADRKPGEVCRASCNAVIGGRGLTPNGDGLYFLRWQIGENRSNVLCFLFKEGKWQSLPVLFNERDWEEQKVREKIEQNQPPEGTR